jgi:segregation and condensation protein A
MKSALTDACTLKLEKFEGPFDLLFFLIEKNQIDLYDIPISEITDQYLDYLNAMQELDLEIASEFLIMAATLLHIKSRMLLPGRETLSEDEADPREELILRLAEYKKYKEFSAVLKDREEKWEHVHYKLPEALPGPEEETELEVSPENLRLCFRDLLKKYHEKMDDVSSKMERILNREKVSLRVKVKEILDLLGKGIKIHFSKLYNKNQKSRLEVATGFLAVLEIVKVGRAEVEQASAFEEIYITPAQNERYNETISVLEDD